MVAINKIYLTNPIEGVEDYFTALVDCGELKEVVVDKEGKIVSSPYDLILFHKKEKDSLKFVAKTSLIPGFKFIVAEIKNGKENMIAALNDIHLAYKILEECDIDLNEGE